MLISSFDDRIHEHRRETRVAPRIAHRTGRSGPADGRPASGSRNPYAYDPWISSTAPLIPASSPSLTSSISTAEAAPLRPPRVHPHEHLRPILRFGAAGAGADLDLRVAEIILAREQRPQLERVQLFAGGVDQVIQLGRHARVGLGPQELVELRRALQLRDQPVVRLGDDFQRLDPLHHLAGALRPVPERRRPPWSPRAPPASRAACQCQRYPRSSANRSALRRSSRSRSTSAMERKISTKRNG